MKSTLLLIFVILTLNIFSQENKIKAIEGDLKLAKVRMDKEIKDPVLGNKAQTWYLRAYVYNELAKSKVYGNLEKYPGEKALESINKCKELDTKNEYYSELITILLELGPTLYNKGITAYNAAVQNKDINGFKTALYYFDKFYEVTDILGKDDKKFIDQFIKYNGINPQKTYIYAGYAAQQTQEYEKAHKYYNTIIDINASDEHEKANSFPLVYFYEAELLVKENKIDKAELVINKGIKVWPNSQELTISAINIYKKKGDDDKLVEVMETALKSNPKNVTLLYTMARTYNNLSKKFRKNGYQGAANKYRTEAINAYKKAISLKPSKKQTLFRLNYNLGIIYFNKAARDYNEQIGTIDDYQNTLREAMPYLEAAKAIKTTTNIDKMLYKIYTTLEMPEKAKTVEQ
jgi:tetratricopeptide (TPR) repeat protein